MNKKLQRFYVPASEVTIFLKTVLLYFQLKNLLRKILEQQTTRINIKKRHMSHPSKKKVPINVIDEIYITFALK